MVLHRENTMQKAASNSKLHQQYPIHVFLRLLCRLKQQLLQSQSLIMEDPKKREAVQMTIDNWPQPTEFRSWKIGFKREVSHSSQHPRSAVPWVGEAEDSENIDELITSASVTGAPIPGFEILDFKLASADSGYPNRKLQETSHHRQPKEMLNPRSDLLQADRLLG